MSILQGKKIILGISGGIAVYKSAFLTRLLKKEGTEVSVIMTKSAAEFVQPLTFQVLSGNKVHVEIFGDEWLPIPHISLTDDADAFIIAPATANILAKTANGIADDLLSASFLAFDGMKIIAPAMNTRMLENPATAQNLNVLTGRGMIVAEPGEGLLACGTKGGGRMAEPEDIMNILKDSIRHSQDFSGKKILITAGATKEPLDPIRIFTNRSTGKMGHYLAEEAYKRGAEVHLVTASQIKSADGIKRFQVNTAQEMHKAVMQVRDKMDVIIMVAAVADYRPENISESKIKKGEALSVSFVRNPDILMELGDRKKNNQILIGFAAESENILENAKEKLRKKNLDMIVANSTEAFGAEKSKVYIISSGKDEIKIIEDKSKREISKNVLDNIMRITQEGVV